MPKHAYHQPRARRIVAAVRVPALLLLAGAVAGSAATAAVTATTAGQRQAAPASAGAAPAAAAPATPAPAAPAPAARHTAYDPVTGKTVTVTEPTDSTPVHPEAVSHPQQDGMSAGASTAGQPGAGSQEAVLTASRGLRGIDVSSHQGPVRWSSVAPKVSFVYAKATEGTSYRNPDFTNQYEGPYNAGKMHGAYHMAIPSNSGGAAQANYFAHHGGGWSRDGRTLPGALDIEPNPYGSNMCYGMSRTQLTTWISNFVHQYAFDTGVFPVIYTTNYFWRDCTGNTARFRSLDPLWVACYCSSAGALPGGYGYYTFWQFSDGGSLPGDQDVFNGSAARLQALVRG